MGDPKGFLNIERALPGDPKRDPAVRVGDQEHTIRLLPIAEVETQARRCMQCAVPFCHTGCPLGNLIPEWNELVNQSRWREALDRLLITNNFPEFTGFTCPAPCEPACTLEINDDPVMIKSVELSIIEHAFAQGWIAPQPPTWRSGRSVGIVGSGPAGLAVADQLNKAGHRAVIYERDEQPGGLLRFGIPDFKLEKHIIDRRMAVLEAEGVEVRCGVDVGVDVTTEQLRTRHDAVVLAVGARLHRMLDVPGGKVGGVHLAMDYLYDRNRAVAAGEPQRHGGRITAAGKDVVVIGGGDTAADCIANALREQARSVVQLDRYPQPLGQRPRDISGWPLQPKRYQTTYALEEGGERRWGAVTRELIAEDGAVTAVRFERTEGPPDFATIAGSEETLAAQLVLVAIGFVGPERDALLDALDLGQDRYGNVATAEQGYATRAPGVFACGDARMGQSLVVWAIDEGRRCAAEVARYLAQDAATPSEQAWRAGRSVLGVR